jgi:hypothetical protein
MKALPNITGFYKALVEKLDLVCDCRYRWSVSIEQDGFTYCMTCGRYVAMIDEGDANRRQE